MEGYCICVRCHWPSALALINLLQAAMVQLCVERDLMGHFVFQCETEGEGIARIDRGLVTLNWLVATSVQHAY